jgi:hypothetical protein
MSTPVFLTQKESNPCQNEPVNSLPTEQGRAGNVHPGKEYPWRSRLAGFLEPLTTGLHHFALLRGFLEEFRSLVPRMVLQYKRRYDLYGLALGSFHEMTPEGHLRWNRRTHACSADIESFVASHPWATMIDREFYRDAWARGAEWGTHNPCSSRQDNLAQETSVNSEQAVLELTKCDRLSPPPSRA